MDIVIRVSRSKRTRKQMPQIEDVAAFALWLRERGIPYRWRWLSAIRLRPTQNEIDLSKVDKLAHAGLDTRRYPVLTSRDRFIIDGHHRAWAARWMRVKVYTLIVGRSKRSTVKLALSWRGKAPNKGIKHADRIEVTR
jgi:hypothetical protein